MEREKTKKANLAEHGNAAKPLSFYPLKVDAVCRAVQGEADLSLRSRPLRDKLAVHQPLARYLPNQAARPLAVSNLPLGISEIELRSDSGASVAG